MAEGESRYKYVRVDLPLWEEVMAGYQAHHPGARCEAGRVLREVSNAYIDGELEGQEEEWLWDSDSRMPVRNGAQHRNIHVRAELLADVLEAYRQRHDTPFGSHAGITRFILSLYLKRMADEEGVREATQRRPGSPTTTVPGSPLM